MKKYLFIFVMALALFPQSKAEATAYYIDFTAAGGNGLATTTAFSSLDAFTEVARSAGDIAFVRRGVASTTNPSDLNFTSDGSINNPIIITADYDNLWSDFATSSQTYTVAVATSTFYANASITGISAGNWIYVAGDCGETYNATTFNKCAYAYEVASVSGTALNLYIPYKGNQSGSGLDLRVMPSAPRWHDANQDFQWNFDTDNYWMVKGIDIRGTDANGQVEIDSSFGHVFFDSIFTGNGASDTGLLSTDDTILAYIRKTRFSANGSGNIGNSLDTYGNLYIYDSHFTGSSGANISGNSNPPRGSWDIYCYDCIFFAGTTDIGLVGVGSTLDIRNPKFSNVANPIAGADGTTFGLLDAGIYIQDRGIIGYNTFGGDAAGTNANTNLTESTTSASFIRAGGGPVSTRVAPTTRTGSAWDFNAIKIFEYPIYANTSSKQYDLYFMSTSTSGWTANPTEDELWVECEYWAHNTGATTTRKIKKSTGTVNFTGSTAWQSISVTCQPTQTGILYLRGWYVKTQESGKMNEFYVDGTPVIN